MRHCVTGHLFKHFLEAYEHGKMQSELSCIHDQYENNGDALRRSGDHQRV